MEPFNQKEGHQHTGVLLGERIFNCHVFYGCSDGRPILVNGWPSHILVSGAPPWDNLLNLYTQAILEYKDWEGTEYKDWKELNG
jgi:hypothetical protein